MSKPKKDVYMIGLCAPKGSGKSTAAKFLKEKLGFERHSFADPLKSALRVAFGLSYDQLYGSLKEEETHLLCGKTPRYAMMTFGNEWGRQMIHNDVWINAWRNTMPDSNRICVDDVRYPNEAQMLRDDYNAIIVRVIRPGFDYYDSHESESHSDIDVDYTVENNGDIYSFGKSIDALVCLDMLNRSKTYDE